MNIEVDLGWALFAIVRRYRHLTDDLLTDLPGGPRGYQVLLASQHGGPRTQAALAQYLSLDRTVMTYLLDDLETAGLVERRPDPADRRARRIEVTEAGSAALAAAVERLRDVETSLLAPLSPEKQQSLRVLLSELAGGSDVEEDPPLTEDVVKARRPRRNSVR
ncbi:MarR family winged helix-turn-helix transcriptional regulator [Amycolatopsis jejuensis]|uniref:MarR family winged helix-turn-helix transcriptional regulator n=1 Tax=Amycolatopsis jejuensis TaxID=330084 RepID=UPI000524829E|nr:MarR family winged helix-turn-helix transcriptional regulator [Amycolatopsis jejuensis]